MTTSDRTSRTGTVESTVALDGVESHVCLDGPHGAPALLLIHGTAASARSWEPMLPLLTGSRRVIRTYLNERSLPERLAPLGKALLVIFGAEDSRWRPSSATDYHSVPGATVEIVPGLGHSPNLEDPPRAAAPLLAFTAIPDRRNTTP